MYNPGTRAVNFNEFKVLYNNLALITWRFFKNTGVWASSQKFQFNCFRMKVKVLAAQSCPTLYNTMDCSPPGSSVCGIFQARILEWITISFSRGSSWPRDWSWVSCVSCIVRWILYNCATSETHYEHCSAIKKEWTSDVL